VSCGPRRAAALSPEDRRAALIAATLPLVLTSGTDVSTRQIAEAAGVAEGTIFRVFPTKKDLLDAVVAHAFDPSALLDGLRQVDRTTSLEDRMIAAVTLMQQRTRQIWHLLHALGGRPGADGSRPPGSEAQWAAVEARIPDAVAALIEPDRKRLRCGPLEAARRLRLVTLATSHPRLTGGESLSPADTVSLLLDGIRLHGEPPAGQLFPAHVPSSPIGATPC
jgi:AcrR family transcriptional regulator